jgi:hypothetical protein
LHAITSHADTVYIKSFMVELVAFSSKQREMNPGPSASP